MPTNPGIPQAWGTGTPEELKVSIALTELPYPESASLSQGKSWLKLPTCGSVAMGVKGVPA